MLHDGAEGSVAAVPSSSMCHAFREFVDSQEDLNDTGDVASQLPSDAHDDDDDWLDGKEDGVLFTLIGDDDDGVQHHQRSPDPHHRGFDSISESSTISLERQMNTFHQTTERTLNEMLDTLRRRTMSPSAMDAAEETLRTSSPVEWNPYRPPRGAQYRDRLEAQQVLEWRSYARTALHIQGGGFARRTRDTAGGTGSDEDGFRKMGGDFHFASEATDHFDLAAAAAANSLAHGVQWVPSCTAFTAAAVVAACNHSSIEADNADVAAEASLVIRGSSIVCDTNVEAVAPGVLCAHGGVLEEWMVRHSDDGDGTYNEEEVLAVGGSAELGGGVDESRRLRCGLPPLSPRAAAEEERHDALVIRWWHAIAEPALQAAGLLRSHDDPPQRNGTPQATPLSDAAIRGSSCATTIDISRCVRRFDSASAVLPHVEVGGISDAHDSDDTGAVVVLPPNASARGGRTTTWLHQQRTPNKVHAQQAYQRPCVPQPAGSGHSRDGTPERGELMQAQEAPQGPSARQSRRLKRSALPRGKPASSSPPPRRTHSLDKQPVSSAGPQQLLMVQGGRIGSGDHPTPQSHHNLNQHQRHLISRGDRTQSPPPTAMDDSAEGGDAGRQSHHSSRYEGAVVVHHHVSRNRPETLRRLTKDQQQSALALLEEEAASYDVSSHGNAGHGNAPRNAQQHPLEGHGDHARRRSDAHTSVLCQGVVESQPLMSVVGRQCSVFTDRDTEVISGPQRPPSGATELLPTSSCVRLPDIGSSGGGGHRRAPMSQQSVKSLSRAQTAYVRPTRKKSVV